VATAHKDRRFNHLAPCNEFARISGVRVLFLRGLEEDAWRAKAKDAFRADPCRRNQGGHRIAATDSDAEAPGGRQEAAGLSAVRHASYVGGDTAMEGPHLRPLPGVHKRVRPVVLQSHLARVRTAGACNRQPRDESGRSGATSVAPVDLPPFSPSRLDRRAHVTAAGRRCNGTQCQASGARAAVPCRRRMCAAGIRLAPLRAYHRVRP
jgi:hypothetical protein